ncbi:MAG TPA: hypothetical protein VGR84_02980 [Candidatus Acidoferrales bacterium]|nr:hypothetical protein [Candidatus Acidoferrales bacterium]
MKPQSIFPRKRQEAGVALLIAIFILLLVSGIALALVANSGSESSLAGNYRSSTSVNDAGFAGLEEARGRLLSGSPNDFNLTVPGFIPVGAPLAVGQVRYILNPVNPADVVAPTTPGSAYFDNEYQQEFGVAVTAAVTQTIPSVWANSAVAGMPSPMYKWVRITPATEQSLNIDVDGDGLPPDPVTPLYYDSAPASGAKPSLIVVPTAPVGVPSTASQAFEVTALAVLPNGSRKIEQYVVTQVSLNLNLPSALTLPGPLGSFNPPNSKGYCMDGNDTSQTTTVAGCSFTPAPAVPGCSTTTPAVPAIGVSPGNDNAGSQTNLNYVDTQIPRPTNYVGSTGTTPSVSTPPLPPNMSSPAALQQELATIQQNANVCLGCSGGGGSTYTFSNLDTASGSLWSSCGTSCGTTPQITYVNGNLDISGSTAGSGILVVTGNLTYDGNSSWNGIILVVGNGLTTYVQNGGGNGQFNGAIFVANTAGNPPGTYGPADFTINGGGGNGVYYNSCWIKNSQKPITYQVLSYREIAQ